MLDVANIASKNPFQLFQSWFHAAKSRDYIKVPHAMCLATSTP
jgi:pyridoxine/pyridoxamine 5'-phosphate oxidase